MFVWEIAQNYIFKLLVKKHEAVTAREGFGNVDGENHEY